MNPATLSPDTARHLREERRQAVSRRLRITAWQVLVLALILGAWEGLTRIPWFVQNTLFDPFFISQPSRVALRLWQWLQPGPQSVWPHLWLTLQATLVGLVVGVGSGFAVGLALARSRLLADIFNPFIVAFNSMPRIAFVPLITMFFGLGLASKVVTSWFVVFFLVFFNTYKGGRSVERELVDFCRTLGGSPRQILWRVQIPTAAAWTFAALPNAISFALIGVVLAEFVGSTTGMGYLMITALATLNATDMFAAVTLLSVVGIVLVYCVTWLERRLLHWAPEFRE
ncbi:ABC transporter permease [Bordetella hinzii]|uniref:ABC transporter, permease protein n=1 Tax=Bordetella hinzii OH87 BAL007II TaxID=1331262 RepID=A0ABR4R458_9BORD|nr:ABC transporter permease [Bordetella hinzii]AKQ57850.1 Putative aliphatic sulfonates transport permease protein SsuC [Bordetella hinzii]AKQ62316.1 Putative aliphatic sulfonates transport permease protein SsuC [Bordetella hinzii]KCB25252.1 ABC transporter, permease protein [Bordetella hinzii OH87 BAL007II]KCB29830.1 ABC transporter, permease protein [Bordetella hinzii CA90 BAL1384]KCB33830.1 ABC transporter, permease protein [Bordetella hinzii L60]